jgi:hypothetical protein
MSSTRIFCLITILIIALQACTPDTPDSLPLEGTWELLSETKVENGDTTFTPASKDQRMLKIINNTHFAFLRHTLNPEKDSTAFVAGGGTYDLLGNVYTEHLQFFIQRAWENHDFKFTVAIRNDTLIQQGQEKVEATGVDRYIIEKYRRVAD